MLIVLPNLLVILCSLARKGGSRAGSSRAENMIWISRIRGFAAQTPVHTSGAPNRRQYTPVHHTDRHQCTPVHKTDTTVAPTCFHLHCIACSQVYSELHCSAMQYCTKLRTQLQCWGAIVFAVFAAYTSICCVFQYLLHIQVFAASVVLRATVQRGRPLTCSGSGCCGTLQQLNIHETSPKIRNN